MESPHNGPTLSPVLQEQHLNASLLAAAAAAGAGIHNVIGFNKATSSLNGMYYKSECY